MTGVVQVSHPDPKSRVLVRICCCDDPSCLMFCGFFCESEGEKRMKRQTPTVLYKDL